MQTHTGEKPHVCSSCPKRFKTKWDKKNHEKTHNKIQNLIHKKLQICECEMCGKELKGRRGLTDHMEIRKNEKRYYCTFCPLRFYTNSSMRHHGTKQHKPESILPVEKLEVPLRFDFGET